MGFFSRRPAPRPAPVSRPRAAVAEAVPGASVDYLDGPAFDVVGDLHGAHDPLVAILDLLGYAWAMDDRGVLTSARHPAGRRLIFVGDLTDRGDSPYRVMESVRHLVQSGHQCLLGNHDALALSFLQGHYDPSQYLTGFEPTYDALSALGPDERARLQQFLASRPYQVLAGRPGLGTELVVAHAGLDVQSVGRASPAIRSACVHGATAPELYAALKRHDVSDAPPLSGWAAEWAALSQGPYLVFGHIAMTSPLVRGRLVGVDTGSVYGGQLTAFRYPECSLVSVSGAAQG